MGHNQIMKGVNIACDGQRCLFIQSFNLRGEGIDKKVAKMQKKRYSIRSQESGGWIFGRFKGVLHSMLLIRNCGYSLVIFPYFVCGGIQRRRI